MLRLTPISETREEVVLKVEGWLAGKDVALLDEEADRWLRETRHLVLDLKGVRFIDLRGVDLLRRVGKRLELRNGAAFLQALLELHGLI